MVCTRKDESGLLREEESGLLREDESELVMSCVYDRERE